MNKINKAFDKLHASRELKERTYQKIKGRLNEKNKYKKKFILFLPLAFTCACCFFTFYIHDNDIDKASGKDVNLMSTEAPECSSDELLYNNHTYIIDNDRSDVSIDKKIGTLNQANDVLSHNLDSSCHNGAFLYTIKNSNNLAVLDNDNILVYKLKK